MTSFLRLAGSGRSGDGSLLVWSVAEGGRGRRWRALATTAGTITHAILFEVDLDGRPTRFELAAPGGLLTLHPGSTGVMLHGNVVTPAGVRHLAYAWSPDHELEVEGRAVPSAVTAHRLARTAAVGEGTDVRVVAIGSDLAIREGMRRFTRQSATEWRIEGDGATRSFAIDERGIPLGLVGGEEWPLELD